MGLAMRLIGRAGMKIRAGDGFEQSGFPEMLSTPVFYSANPGDRLIAKDSAYKFAVATYRPEINPDWLYTYTYARDQSWTIYNNDLSADAYRQDDYIFRDKVYFRVCLRKISGEDFDSSEDINDILGFETAAGDAAAEKQWLTDEAGRVSERVKPLRAAGDKVFIVLTDSHFNTGGTWDDTACALRLLAGSIAPDAVIHLGDFTDGMVTADATRYYAGNIMKDLKSCGVPLYVTLGNHDYNYFRSNPERFTEDDLRELYLDGKEIRYFVDYPGLRLVFPDSFDPQESLRYGYSGECVEWLSEVLGSAGESKVIIFSHLPPVTRLQYWAKELRGETGLAAATARYKDKIIAWINGHNHADRLDYEEGFPVVSIANAKCEAFLERKPEEFETPERRPGDASQELFDILVVNAEKGEARLVRFGAGRDRTISAGKTQLQS